MKEKQITRITQIGIVTGDLKKMAQTYEEVFGIGPFEVIVDGAHGIGAKAENLTVHGKPQDFEVLVAVCQLEGLEIELIQPLDDKSIYAEHLKKHGEGVINHLAIRTPDNQKFRKLMKEQQVESMMKGDVDPAEGNSFEYFDAGELIGTILELHDPAPVKDETE